MLKGWRGAEIPWGQVNSSGCGGRDFGEPIARLNRNTDGCGKNQCRQARALGISVITVARMKLMSVRDRALPGERDWRNGCTYTLGLLGIVRSNKFCHCIGRFRHTGFGVQPVPCPSWPGLLQNRLLELCCVDRHGIGRALAALMRYRLQRVVLQDEHPRNRRAALPRDALSEEHRVRQLRPVRCSAMAIQGYAGGFCDLADTSWHVMLARERVTDEKDEVVGNSVREARECRGCEPGDCRAREPAPCEPRAQPIVSSSSIIEEMSESPLSQNAGSDASRPNGARSSVWCSVPPAASMSKYLSWKPASPCS